MRATLLDASSGAFVAEINCIIRDYRDPEGDLAGEEGVFDVVEAHREIGIGPAKLRLEDGRQASVIVEKLKQDADTGRTKGIFWLLGKPKR